MPQVCSEEASPSFWLCINFRKEEKNWTGELFCQTWKALKTLKLNKRNFVENSVLCRWLCAPRDSEPADIWGLLMTSITACRLLKKISMMLKIPHSLAWLQAVRMLYSDFYTACWYLDIFTSIMFTIILFFFIKVDCRWIRLEEACLKTGFVLHPTISQLLRISYSALVAHLWSWFWFWAVLDTEGADVPFFMGHGKCQILTLSCCYVCRVWLVLWSVAEHQSLRLPLAHAYLPVKMGPWGSQDRI